MQNSHRIEDTVFAPLERRVVLETTQKAEVNDQQFRGASFFATQSHFIMLERSDAERPLVKCWDLEGSHVMETREPFTMRTPVFCPDFENNLLWTISVGSEIKVVSFRNLGVPLNSTDSIGATLESESPREVAVYIMSHLQRLLQQR